MYGLEKVRLLRLLNDFKSILFILMGITLLSGCVSLGQGQANDSASLEEEKILSEDHTEERFGRGAFVDTRPYLSPKDYRFGIAGAFEGLPYDYEPLDQLGLVSLVGGIVPHHGTAQVMMADFYKQAGKIHKEKPYDLVVVIGPNHQSIGPAIQFASQPFMTYEGLVEVDDSLVTVLTHLTEGAVAERKMLEQEHSQLIQMPYIGHFLKGVPVLSITVTESGNTEALSALGVTLGQLLDTKQVLIVGSIDFSHYLSLEAANNKDLRTRQYLQRGDRLSMQSLRDDHLDAPSSYWLFIELMQGRKASNPVITNHSNSALILGHGGLDETTSYFQVIYP